ncbi:hypothetical protein H0H92_016077 [Tricholoma furcatifolium]|nr:hypothetical protein H0H92_016077 [Tricholoma furcatifolium]
MQTVETTQNQHGLRLLALDDGGIRGLSELIILQEIMHRLKNIASLDSVPKPCDYFDVIGGVGTGGVIALMLGRLQMPIDVAIEEYVKFSKKVYSDVKKYGSEEFKATTFVSAMEDILKVAGYPVDLLILEDNPACRSFVIALPANSMTPCFFRSYKIKAKEHYNCTFVEAACATTQSFKPVDIGPKYLKITKRVNSLVHALYHVPKKVSLGIMNSTSVPSNAKLEYKQQLLPVVAPPSTLFTGREDILLQLEVYFSQSSLVKRQQQRFVLYGLAGAGKTQIMRRFCADNKDSYCTQC